MTVRVVGAGLGRTGTTSLQAALQQLLGGPCYHMHEVFPHPEHIPLWHQAALGNMPDWHRMFDGWVGAIDWPASAFWPELSAAFPDALIILSTRPADAWWKSASNTIFPATRAAEAGPWRDMVEAMFEHRFTAAVDDRDAAISAFEAHNAHVRATAPAARLLEWQASDGWAPICAALELPVPDSAFPHANTTEEFKQRIGRSTPAP